MTGAACICYPGVHLGAGYQIGEYAVLGVLPRGVPPGGLETRIGARAVIRSHTVIYAGNVIGDDFQTGHGVLIREFNQIGDRVSIGSHTIVEHHVVIADDVRIHSNAFVPEFTVLEAGCWLGPNVVCTNAKYPLSLQAKETLRGPHVARRAKVGANATLLPGVRIGEDALVGAGAVVTRDVPRGMVVMGNPARAIGDVTSLSAYQVARLTEGMGE